MFFSIFSIIGFYELWHLVKSGEDLHYSPLRDFAMRMWMAVVQPLAEHFIENHVLNFIICQIEATVNEEVVAHSS